MAEPWRQCSLKEGKWWGWQNVVKTLVCKPTVLLGLVGFYHSKVMPLVSENPPCCIGFCTTAQAWHTPLLHFVNPYCLGGGIMWILRLWRKKRRVIRRSWGRKEMSTLTFYLSVHYIQLHWAYSETDVAHGTSQSMQPFLCMCRMNPSNLGIDDFKCSLESSFHAGAQCGHSARTLEVFAFRKNTKHTWRKYKFQVCFQLMLMQAGVKIYSYRTSNGSELLFWSQGVYWVPSSVCFLIQRNETAAFHNWLFP